jgi:hypothetical protein
LDVGQRIERHLPQAVGGRIAAELGEQRVRGLVHGQADDQRDEPEEGVLPVHRRCPPWLRLGLVCGLVTGVVRAGGMQVLHHLAHLGLGGS